MESICMERVYFLGYKKESKPTLDSTSYTWLPGTKTTICSR